MIIVDIYEKLSVKSKDIKKFCVDISVDGKVQRFEVDLEAGFILLLKSYYDALKMML